MVRRNQHYYDICSMHHIRAMQIELSVRLTSPHRPPPGLRRPSVLSQTRVLLPPSQSMPKAGGKVSLSNKAITLISANLLPTPSFCCNCAWWQVTSRRAAALVIAEQANMKTQNGPHQQQLVPVDRSEQHERIAVLNGNSTSWFVCQLQVLNEQQ